jgi:hypothetical protein
MEGLLDVMLEGLDCEAFPAPALTLLELILTEICQGSIDKREMQMKE